MMKSTTPDHVPPRTIRFYESAEETVKTKIANFVS